MTKKIALLLAFIIMTLSFVLPASAEDIQFTDVPDDAWEAPYVYDLVERGIVSGYGDGTFGSSNTVLRCEYAKMLVGITETPLSGSISSPYVDVPAWEWYFKYVNSSLDYMTGFTVDGQLYFRPEDQATREVVTVALIKALKIDVSSYSDATAYLSERFNDVNTISEHNRAYIAAAVDKGYVTGDIGGTFRGQDPIIRAEIAAVLCRAFPATENVTE